MTASPSPCHNPRGLQEPLDHLNARIIRCRLCPRLVAHRTAVAAPPPRRYVGQHYWAKPLPGFGDPRARLLIVGLAPAAHGGNRTGRMFTGDRSGDWLYRSLYKFGFANQPASTRVGDGLALNDCYITASARCAPPQNKLLPAELRNCRPSLLDELRLLRNVRVIVALGKIAFDTVVDAMRELETTSIPRRPSFGHGKEYVINARQMLIASYH